MTDVKGVGKDQDSMPDPNSSAKPDSPGELDKRSWKYVARKTVREFSDDECTDQAAGLTYYAVLAVFPALLALFSLLGVVGQGQKAVTAITDIMKPLVSKETLNTFTPILESLAQSQGAGLALIVGLAGALWSASAYVGAFGRAMNRIYEIEEGRPFWKLRPLMLVITLVAVLLSALVLVMLIVSGPLAQSIGDAIGLGDTAVTIWNIAKWPVLVAFAVLMIAVLYYGAPNVKQPKFRWMSLGGFIALIVLAITTAAFSLYVANFASYDKTYGAIAGVIILLLWIWLANISLLFGVEFDAEMERGRQLQGGIEAEETIQLPPRDSKAAEKKAEKHLKLVREGRELREKYGRESAQR